MEKKLGITVVICCHNSELTIQNTLSFLEKQKVSPNRNWEVLLVDNNSTDSTVIKAQELSRLSKNLKSRLRIVRESKPGISNARLTALSEAKNEILSFVDDDNFVCEDWIEIVAKIMERHPEIAVCGSRNIEPMIKNKPNWFDKYKECYAIGKQAPKSGDVTKERGFVWGAGMSVRKMAWEDINNKGFKFILTGRVGKTRSAGEDSELCFGLRLGGWRIWYENNLTLIHSIDTTRINWQELRKMFRGFGAGRAGHNPYFFAEQRTNFVQHWYCQVMLVMWELLKHLDKIFVLITDPSRISDDILRIEHKIGQIMFYLSKRNHFDAYTILLRRNFAANRNIR